MLLQDLNVVFSVDLMFRSRCFASKAQRAANGQSLGKRCNAVVRRQASALWVSLSAVLWTALRPLKGSDHSLRDAPCHEF